MRNLYLTDEEFRQKYGLSDNRDWQLSKARVVLRSSGKWEDYLAKCSYRPFDWRYCYFTEIATDYPRRELKDHVFKRENLCLLSSRQQTTLGYRHSWVTREPANDCVISTTSREANQVFPLYLYPTQNESSQKSLFNASPWSPGKEGRIPNLSPEFVAEVEA